MKYISLLLILLLPSALFGQGLEVDITSYTDSTFQQGIDNNKIPSAIVSIVREDSVIVRNEYGLPKGQESIFQVGSVGKLFTSIGVLLLVEDGKLDLDEDIKTYLPRFELQYNRFGILTLRDLLTHTAGFNERYIGYAARSEDDVEPLHTHLEERLPERYTQSSQEISYSNYGYALAGLVIEEVSDKSFHRFIDERIFQPLGMESSFYFIQETKEGIVAVPGYRYSKDDLIELDRFYRNPLPAGGVWSSIDDMTRFMRMLTNGGEVNGTSYLSARSLELLFTQLRTNHEELPGYSLGMEVQEFDNEIAYSKGGSVPGFKSIMIIYPDQNMGMFSSINLDNDEFLEDFVDEFNMKLGLRKRGIETSSQPIELDEYVGSYRENRYSRNTIENIVALTYFNMWKNEDGYLECYHDGEYHQYEALNDEVFINIKYPSRIMVFGRGESGKIEWMSRGSSFAGTLVPARYEKLGWTERHNAVNEIIGYILIFLLVPIFILLIQGGLWLIKKRPARLIGLDYMALAFSLLTLGYFILYFFPVIKGLKTGELLYGMDPGLIKYNFIPFILVIISIVFSYYTFRYWVSNHKKLLKAIYFTLLGLAMVAVVLFLYKWNFIGFYY